VVVRNGTSPIRGYKLLYGTSAATGRTLLASVQLYGTDIAIDANGVITGGSSLPAATFSYENDAVAQSFIGVAPEPPTPVVVENVLWANHTCTYAAGASGNSLQKQSCGFEWNAGASSTRAIASGNGYVQFRAGADGGNKITMIGLSNGDTDATHQDIDFALHETGGVNNNGTQNVAVYEAGFYKGTWPVADGALLTVEVVNGSVYYKSNGTLLLASTRQAVYPLVVDASIHNRFATIHDVVISGSLQDAAPWCYGDPLHTGDFNGDGRTDQLCYRAWGGGTTQVRLATATGFQPAQVWRSNQPFNRITVGDFDNNGRTDIADYVSWDGTFFVALSTGTSFTTPVLWGNASAVAEDGRPYACRIDPATIGTGDFNGDGRPDISCKILGRRESFIGLSTGSAFNFSIFAQLSCDAYEITGAGDFNRDGKDDWYCIGGGGQFYIFPSTGSSFYNPYTAALTSAFCGSDFYYVFGDVNGDGATDVTCRSNGKVALFTGTAFVEWGAYGAFCVEATNVFAADVDGDGASEIVCNNPGAGADDIQVRKWQSSTGLGPLQTWKTGWCSSAVFPGDYNGDGKTDLLCTAQATPLALTGTGGKMSDLLVSARNGVGGVLQPAYVPSTVFSNTNGPPPKYVVTNLTTLDGRGGSSTATFSYEGGLMDRAERRFMGFRRVDEVLPCIDSETTCPLVRRYLRQDSLATVGRPEQIEVWKNRSYAAQVDVFGYTVAVSSQGVHSALPTSEGRYFSDDSASCSVWPCGAWKLAYRTRAHDSYGNVIAVYSYGDYYVAGDERTHTRSFSPNPEAYLVGYPAGEWVFAGIGETGARLSDVRYVYDGASTRLVPPTRGLVTRISRLLGEEGRLVSASFAYDTWGNLTSRTDETNRTTLTTYESARNLYPETTTNPENETERSSWDLRCGGPYETFDANSQRTAIQYDPLCRVARFDYPLGHWEVREYLFFGDASNQQVRVWSPSAVTGGTNYLVSAWFDGLGRRHRATKSGTRPDTGQRQNTRTMWTYNARGGIYQESMPHYAADPVYYTTFSYDGLDRVTRIQHPDGNAVQKSYGIWNETTTDEHGHPQTLAFDAYGNKRTSSQQAGGVTVTTSYQHDMLDRLTGINDAAGNAWTWALDSLGRVRERFDPDSGLWRFDHDDAGRVVSQDDAKNQRTTFEYDPAGRLVRKANPTDTVVTTYGQHRAGFFNVGRVTSVENVASRLDFDYDAAGRVVKQTRVMDGTTYVLDRRYDAAGRLRGITFPDGDAVGTPSDPFRYDEGGRLVAIPGILLNVTYDGASRALRQDNLNGTSTTRTYSATRGFLAGIDTTGPSTIQRLAYTYDAAGMATTVSSPFPNESWSYQYGGFHRLKLATGAIPATTQEFAYDTPGRMTYNSGIGNYLYPPAGADRFHAPSSVAGASYVYDENGNLTSGGGRTLTWNSDNMPSVITTPAAGTTQFTYGGFGERLKKSSPSAISLYPLGDDYEITNGVVTKYISVGGLGVIAKRVGPTTFWHHTDRLGSIQAVTSAAGIEVQRRTYAPYGDRIHNSSTHAESRGYIDQRADETGFIYLHARYYDPALGIFLNPDPIGAAGGLNEYGYALGDPVNGTDRSGLVLEPDHYGRVHAREGESAGMWALFAPGGGVASPAQAGLIAAWEMTLITNGHGGVYAFTGADGSTRVTMNPAGQADSMTNAFTHLNSGLTIALEVEYPVLGRLASNNPTETGLSGGFGGGGAAFVGQLFGAWAVVEGGAGVFSGSGFGSYVSSGRGGSLDPNKGAVLGMFAGAGLTGWISNAAHPNDLAATTHTFFLNTGSPIGPLGPTDLAFGLSFSWGNGIWHLSVNPITGNPMTGIGGGAGIGVIPTTTTGTDWWP